MTISNELLDELLKGVERPEDLLGEAGLMKGYRRIADIGKRSLAPTVDLA